VDQLIPVLRGFTNKPIIRDNQLLKSLAMNQLFETTN